MWLIVFLTTLLGSENYSEREGAYKLLNNPLCALFLPPRDLENPEVDMRLQLLRKANLKYFRQDWWECVALKYDKAHWLRYYLVYGNSVLWTRMEIFEMFHKDNSWGFALVKQFRSPFETTGYLYGGIRPGEYEQFQFHILTHSNARVAVIGGLGREFNWKR